MDDTIMTPDELVEYVIIRDLLFGERGLHYKTEYPRVHDLRGRFIELAPRWRRYEKKIKERRGLETQELPGSCAKVQRASGSC